MALIYNTFLTLLKPVPWAGQSCNMAISSSVRNFFIKRDVYDKAIYHLSCKPLNSHHWILLCCIFQLIFCINWSYFDGIFNSNKPFDDIPEKDLNFRFVSQSILLAGEKSYFAFCFNHKVIMILIQWPTSLNKKTTNYQIIFSVQWLYRNFWDWLLKAGTVPQNKTPGS